MNEMLVLRVIHVLGGMFWFGAACAASLFFVPSILAAGPAAGTVVQGLKQRGFMVVMPVVALLTILAGTRLMQLTSNNFEAAYFQSTRGATYAWAGTAAIAAFVLNLAFDRRIRNRMGAVGAALSQAADPTERQRLQGEMAGLRRRGSVFGALNLLLLTVAAVGMAVARYLF